MATSNEDSSIFAVTFFPRDREHKDVKRNRKLMTTFQASLRAFRFHAAFVYVRSFVWSAAIKVLT